MLDARDGKFDVVVAEGLDRLSRDQEHIASFFKQMQFQGIPIVTVAEGEISELHIGLKGTMSSLFLKDLAQKTHRGMEGRVRKGKSAGGITYGYDVVRELRADGTFTTGERVINQEQAAIVQRIFEEFASGYSPRAICGRLNDDDIDGPRGTGWGMSTIYGNWRRGTGILNNELYQGRLIWNRQRFIKDPNSGKRQARMNPPEDWIIEEVPDLRLILDDLWNRVKSRQKATRSEVISDGVIRAERAKRPKHLFSGALTCGTCGGGFTIVGKTYFGCANARNKGTCNNRLSILQADLEGRVLSGLKDHLLHPDLIAEFARSYQEEYNRLAATIGQDHAKAERDLAKTAKQIDSIIEAITEGMFHPSLKAKMDELEAQKARLEAKLAETDSNPPVLLHPGLADMYRSKVANLTNALNEPSTRTEAGEIILSLLTSITLTPDGEALAIELVGELAGLLALGNPRNAESHPKVACSVTMVAGVRFELTTFRL
ncbi:recombinase family protein [Falsihalocynthiibacter sp. BN13B15]|uniref:recombinase family protein n=1 Tax=Falsihalocynthiibacter sp. BN13B15 TaxID=3240871 RepID=UPI00350FD0E1